MKLLYAEDEPALSEAVVDYLTYHKYIVDAVYDGADAYDYAMSGEYDGIILDIMMPKRDGLEVLSALRRNGCRTPVLLLTAKTQVEDRIRGLDTGADDYVTKPFSVNELLSRIKANIRRSRGEVVSSSAEAKQEIIEIRGLKIDTSHYSVEIDGKAIDDITKKDYEILLLLAKNPGKVFTFEEICSKIWGYDFCGEDEKQTVTTAVHRLRAKLESNSQEPEYVHNKRGVGYYLK